MITHNLIQGSPEWDAFRLEHFGASEAAAMLGLSKKVTRTELLHMKSTGTAREFGDWVQKNILDYGHEVEALARPIIEEIFGIDLYPVTCSDGRGSASCDGLSMCETDAFEHKQPNKELVASVRAGIVPEEHMPQCQQILMVTGAKRVIFTVSDGTRENMVWTEVFPDPAWFERIRAGWAQFAKDRENYVHVVHAEKPKAEVSIQLPALFINAKGAITSSNMEEYGEALAGKLAEVRSIMLITDQDFSNAKEAAKIFREQCDKLELAKEAMLAQTVSIGEAARMMDAWHEDLRLTALKLEKDVEREDTAKKRAMVSRAQSLYQDYVNELYAETKPIELNVPRPDFAAAIKGKRNYASMHDAIDTVLANSKIAADSVAKDIRAKLAWHKENAAGYEFLFADMQQIAYKPADDFQMLVKNRIDQHKLDENKKIEEKAAELVASQNAAPVIAPASEAPKPTLVKIESKVSSKQSSIGNVDGIMLALARRDAEAFRTKFSCLSELVMVMEEIDSFLMATAPAEAQYELAGS